MEGGQNGMGVREGSRRSGKGEERSAGSEGKEGRGKGRTRVKELMEE